MEEKPIEPEPEKFEGEQNKRIGTPDSFWNGRKGKEKKERKKREKREKNETADSVAEQTRRTWDNGTGCSSKLR